MNPHERAVLHAPAWRQIAIAVGLAALMAGDAGADAPPVFDYAWGSQGSLPGQMNQPFAIAVASDHSVYVLDGGNSRVERFSPLGAFISAWQISGSPASFGLALDAAGHVYVPKASEGRVQVFDGSGLVIREFGSNAKITNPTGIAVAGNGTCFVGTQGLNQVAVYDGTGQFLKNLAGAFVLQPWDLALDESGNIFVTAFSGRAIFKFNSSGQYVTQWQLVVPGDLLFYTPAGIVARNGSVIVADADNSRLVAFSTDGAFQWSVSLPGGPVGHDAFDVAWDGDSGYFVLDRAGARVLHFGPQAVPAPATSWGRIKATYR